MICVRESNAAKETEDYDVLVALMFLVMMCSRSLLQVHVMDIGL